MNNLQLRQEVPIRSRDVEVYDSAYAFNESNAFSVQNEGNNVAECLATLLNHSYLTGGIQNSNALQNRISNRVDLYSLAMQKCPGKISAIAVSSDGQLCAGALTSNIYIWQVATGGLLCILKKHSEEVTCLRFDSKGSCLVSGGADFLVMVWRLDSILTAEAQEHIQPSYIWSGHSKIIDIYMSQFAATSSVVTVSDQLCEVYLLKSGKCIRKISSHVSLSSVTVDSAEFFIFLGNTSGEVIQCMRYDYSESPNDKNAEFPMWTFHLHEKTVSCLATSLDGEVLFSGSIDCTVVVWNIYTQTVMHKLRHSGPVLNGYFTPNPLMKGDSWKTMKPFQFEIESSNVDELEVLPKSFKLETEYDDTTDKNIPVMAADLNTTSSGLEESVNDGIFMFMKRYMAEGTLEDVSLKNTIY